MRTLISGVVIAALALVHPGAQAPPPQQQPSVRPPFRSDATLVTVDVYPTKDGQPVEGLTKDDFEIREDGVPQEIEAFEFVSIEPGSPESELRDPNNQQEMLDRIADPRTRLFVVYLDTYHVDLAGSHISRAPLTMMLNRLLAPTDLFAVMTPKMDARGMVFARRTLSIEAQLEKHWEWGDASKPYLDELETMLENCYASTAAGMLPELYARHREDLVFTTLEDMVSRLEGMREGRKVVFILSNGWRLFDRSDDIIRLLAELGPMKAPPIGVTSLGKPRLGTDIKDGTLFACDAEASRLAQLEHGRRYRDLLRAAAQANVAFYPVHLGGVGASSRTVQAFQSLASETDGDSVTMTNDLLTGVDRIARGLSAYYLLGYASTNTRFDGRSRRIDVRVKQPGIDVRARRGYRAMTEAERDTMNAVAAPVSPLARGVNAAVAELAQIRPEVKFYVNAVTFTGERGTQAWVTGEVIRSAVRADFAKGGTVDVTLGSGAHSVTTEVALEPGARTFVTSIALPRPPDVGAPVRARLTAPSATIPLLATAAVAADGRSARLFRRGPATGNRLDPAADRRFSRTERLHLEIPAGAAVRPASARLLDTRAQPLSVPVTIGERRDDAAGVRWITADLTLAPLGAGDYVIEVVVSGPNGDRNVLTAIRVTR